MNHGVRSNYFVVVVLPSRQIKRVVRLAACNFERCVFETIIFRCKIRLRRIHTITLHQINYKNNDLIDSKIKIRAEVQSIGNVQSVRGLRLT